MALAVIMGWYVVIGVLAAIGTVTVTRSQFSPPARTFGQQVATVTQLAPIVWAGSALVAGLVAGVACGVVAVAVVWLTTTNAPWRADPAA